ncbi:hypothetical protein HRbin40_00446 [bacterium HR40]|nr:hypothetical protein HRbin40_00446 [bacterium HR40]
MHRVAHAGRRAGGEAALVIASTSRDHRPFELAATACLGSLTMRGLAPIQGEQGGAPGRARR